MKKSIRALFEALEQAAGGKAPAGAEKDQPAGAKEEPMGGEAGGKEPVSPAERVGRALLDRLGSGTGLSEEELADAIIAVWNDPESLGLGKKPYEESEIAGKERGLPFGGHTRMPMPMRSGASAGAHIDYDELTDEQFRSLKRQLQKAAADGKRVRL